MEKIKIGDYAYERYRIVYNENGEEIKQGMGLKGIVENIFTHKLTKEKIVEFKNGEAYRFCLLKWVTANEELASKVIGEVQHYMEYKKEREICKYLGLKVDNANQVLAWYGYGFSDGGKIPTGWQMVCHLSKLKKYLSSKIHKEHYNRA